MAFQLRIKKYVHDVFRQIWQQEKNLGYDDIPEPFDHLINYVIEIALNHADNVPPNRQDSYNLSRLLGGMLGMIQEAKDAKYAQSQSDLQSVKKQLQTCYDERKQLKMENIELKKAINALQASCVTSDEHMGKRKSHKKFKEYIKKIN